MAKLEKFVEPDIPYSLFLQNNIILKQHFGRFLVLKRRLRGIKKTFECSNYYEI